MENLRTIKTRTEVIVMLLSLHAASAGLDITEANHVICLDQWWNPAVEDQAVDRTHRIGQNKTVHIYHIVVKGSIEEKIIHRENLKRDMAEQVLHGNDLIAGSQDALPGLREWREVCKYGKEAAIKNALDVSDIDIDSG